MRHEKMQLVLVASSQMDQRARHEAYEHRVVRLSKKARLHYQPADWKKSYINVQGNKATKRLRVAQALLEDIREEGRDNSKTMGFVTTKTYKELMGPQKSKKSIWISEATLEIVIGADPEFVLLKTRDGEAVYADHVFPGHKWDQVGSDGPCAEIRPDPSAKVEDFINNIKSLFDNQTDAIKDYEWITGATYRHVNMERRYCIGGHLHFGLPDIPGAAQDTKTVYQNRIVRVLSELIAIPLVKIDQPMPKERRLGVGNWMGYGKVDDAKTYDYKFEWRTLSGIWLINPELAHATISASKAVVEECWKRYADRGHSDNFMLLSTGDNLVGSFSNLHIEKVTALVHNSDPTAVTKTILSGIKKTMKEMSTYSHYKEEIEDFFKLCNHKVSPKDLYFRKSWV